MTYEIEIEAYRYTLFSHKTLTVEQGPLFSKVTAAETATIKLALPRGSLLCWPNREGELLEVDKIPTTLKEYQLLQARLIYPSTASASLFALYQPEKRGGLLLSSPPDFEGRIKEFSLTYSEEGSSLLISMAPGSLTLSPFKGESLEEFFSRFPKELFPPSLPVRVDSPRYQIQLGFFHPDGSHSLPEGRGFSVCREVSELVFKYRGGGQIIHLFAYHGAHDSNFPDYTPAESLGGVKGFVEALKMIHKRGHLVSLYMNARLIDERQLYRFPKLLDHLAVDRKGRREREVYRGRTFFVVNPLSSYWREILIEEAARLKEMGADIVQLDQVAGRKGVGDIGAKWGEGYRLLIEQIQALGLKVWIQGVTDIYPANWFELCYRKASLLDDGTIRGGTPFGKSFPYVPMVLQNQCYIVPLAKKALSEFLPKEQVTVDLETVPAELSLYSERYMRQLEEALKLEA